MRPGASGASFDAADVAVLGAGIIGSGIARELAIRGHRVVLIDRSEPCSGSSGRCDGNVLVQTKHSADMVRLTLQSIEGYRRWVRDLDADMRFEQRGSIVFYTNETQLAGRDARAEVLTRLGVTVDLVDKRGVRQREPALDGPLIGGLDCLDDASVYPPAVVTALVRDLVRSGGRVLARTHARSLTLDRSGHVSGVETNRGHLSAPVVVNALGVWSAGLSTPFHTSVPIEPRQGVLLVTEEVPGLFRRAVTEAGYLDLRVARPADQPESPVFVAEPTYRGNILIGSTRRFVGEDTEVDMSLVRDVAARASHFSSALSRVQIIRSFAGLRPWTPDNAPIIGEVADMPGYVLATGHEGEGIGLAPATADIVCKLIDGQVMSPLQEAILALSRPDRFTLVPQGQGEQ